MKSIQHLGYISGAILLLVITACSTQKIQPASVQFSRTGEVRQVASDRSTITVLSQYRAESLNKAVRYAEINALENLLFKGLPDSVQEQPIIEDEAIAMKNYRSVLKSLIDDGGYEKYLIESFIDHSEKQNQYFFVRQSITLDINSLRKHLEKEGVIRKFGL